MIVVITLIFTYFSISKDRTNENITQYKTSHIEGSDFETVEQAYFGDSINFDATEYTNSQNKEYYWSFGDGSFAEGDIVQHCYELEGKYDLEYPLVYSVTLMAYDGYESVSTTHQIKLYPKNYIFYLDSNRLSDEIPTESKEEVGTINKLETELTKCLNYELEEPVTLSKAEWTATLHIEKPFFLRINKVSISLLDKNENKISSKDEKIGFESYGRQKTIEITGSIENEIELNSIEISFYGFSIGEKIDILYGGEKASKIVFNFS